METTRAGCLHEFSIEAMRVNGPFGTNEHVLQLKTPGGHVILKTKPFKDKPVEIDDLYSRLFNYCEQELKKFEG
jgi:hypothetical protein